MHWVYIHAELNGASPISVACETVKLFTFSEGPTYYGCTTVQSSFAWSVNGFDGVPLQNFHPSYLIGIKEDSFF